MEEKDDFTFSIEGKDYTISEKKSNPEKNNKQTLHAPSLGIGAIIAGICIAGVFFGMGDFSESSEPLIEKQIIVEEPEPVEITIDTFLANGSPVLGIANAPITLVEFGDYQCHFCHVYFENTEKKIFEDYVKTGKVNVIFKDYNIIGPDSVRASHAAQCAGDQNKFWQYHHTLFHNYDGENSGWATQNNLNMFAEELGLDMQKFEKCTIQLEFGEKVSKSNEDAKTLGITGTPAFYIISTNTGQIQHVQGAQPYEVFERIFNSMLEN